MQRGGGNESEGLAGAVRVTPPRPAVYSPNLGGRY